jgi:cbb3-type cytochrome oxidase maturation protein
MSIIYVLIPIAILLTSIAIYLFFWAVKTEQFDDLEKQGMSILFDEPTINNSEKLANTDDDKHSNNTDNQ